MSACQHVHTTRKRDDKQKELQQVKSSVISPQKKGNVTTERIPDIGKENIMCLAKFQNSILKS